jgi:hypothetical protein
MSESILMKQPLPIIWQRYKVRKRKKAFYHEWCEICEERIVCGQKYRDGGYGRRAHKECAERAFNFPARLVGTDMTEADESPIG